MKATITFRGSGAIATCWFMVLVRATLDVIVVVVGIVVGVVVVGWQDVMVLSSPFVVVIPRFALSSCRWRRTWECGPICRWRFGCTWRFLRPPLSWCCMVVTPCCIVDSHRLLELPPHSEQFVELCGVKLGWSILCVAWSVIMVVVVTVVVVDTIIIVCVVVVHFDRGSDPFAMPLLVLGHIGPADNGCGGAAGWLCLLAELLGVGGGIAVLGCFGGESPTGGGGLFMVEIGNSLGSHACGGGVPFSPALPSGATMGAEGGVRLMGALWFLIGRALGACCGKRDSVWAWLGCDPSALDQPRYR